ncbi:MAG: TRAP transporter substrate-binding protein DctP [Rhodospirillales bacterium]|nr:TRAP transporter substrate-binding protein DctP [Rhodospirillales bacterium]
MRGKRSWAVVALAAAVIWLCNGASIASAKTLKMATSWGGGPHLEDLAKGFAKKAKFLTNGEIEFEVFPGGTLGSPLKVTETVRNGVADAGHHWSGYDWGTDKTAVLFGGYAGSMPEEHYLHWLFVGGGSEMWMQWRLEKHGVVAFPCGTHSDEVFMHSRKRIQTLEDFKGIKLRTSGAWAEIAQTLGASTVVLPGAEVYPALERGVVDAIEWATPWINERVGFHKIAKYVILPGLHQASSSQECVFRKDVWDGFTDRQRELLILAGKMTSLDAFMMFNDGDVEALRTFQKAGNELVIVDDAFKQAKEKATNAWIDKTKKELGGWFAKVVDSQRAYYEKWSTASLYRSEIR